MGLPTATVRMRGPDGITRSSTGMGTGPFDATCQAINSLVRVPVSPLAAHSGPAQQYQPLRMQAPDVGNQVIHNIIIIIGSLILIVDII